MAVARSLVAPILSVVALGATAAAAATGPTADQVKAAVQKARPAMKLTWKGVQIAAGRRASPGESSAAGMPYPVTVYPARVAFTEQSSPGSRREVTWNYYIYKGDFGDWTAASNAVPGNLEGPLH